MKKVFAILFAVALIATMSVTAFAADITTNGGEGDTRVTFNVDPTYTITIPATVTLEKAEEDGTILYGNVCVITASAGVRLLKGYEIVVTVESDFTMETKEKATLEYEIYRNASTVESDGTVATFDTSETEQASEIIIIANDPEYAGEYEDIVTFTISVQKYTGPM